MQAEYCDTVALQLDGMALQSAVAGSAFRHVLSWLAQICCSEASLSGLLDTPSDNPAHLHNSAWSMVLAK
jgi:hypothetical protein